MLKIAPSMISADFSILKEEILSLQNASADILHFDVMDNHFVPNLTFGPKLIQDCKKHSSIPFEVHLMIQNPHNHIQQFLNTQAQIITLQFESLSHQQIHNIASHISQNHQKFSLAISPHTPIKEIIPFIHIPYSFLIMTVQPGYSGQKILPHTFPKIQLLNSILSKNQLHTLISVDGGINLSNIKLLHQLGASITVIGSALFSSKNYSQFILQAQKKTQKKIL